MGVAELIAAFRDNEEGPDFEEVLAELVASITSVIPGNTAVVGGILQVDPHDSESGAIRQGYIYGDGTFIYDSTDTTTEHDGITCLVLIGGYRYFVIGNIKVKAVEQVGIDEEPELTDSDYGKSYIDLTGVVGAANSIIVWTSRGWIEIDPDYGPPIFVKSATDGYPANSYVHWQGGDGWVTGLGTGLAAPASVPLSALLWDGRVVNQTTAEPPASWSKGAAYIASAEADGDPWTAGKLYIAENDGVLEDGDTFAEYTPWTGLKVFDLDPSVNGEVEWDGLAWLPVVSGYRSVDPFTDLADASLSSTGSNASSTATQYSATTPPTQSVNKAKIFETLAPTIKTNRDDQDIEIIYSADLTAAFAATVSIGSRGNVIAAIFIDDETNARDWQYVTTANIGTRLTQRFLLNLADADEYTLTLMFQICGSVTGDTISAASVGIARRHFVVRNLS